MDALQAAQSVYNSTIRNLAGKDVELDVATSLQVATFCAALAQAEQLAMIAEYLNVISNQLTHVANETMEFSIAESLYGIEQNTR